MTAVEMPKIREEDTEEAEKYKERERMKKWKHQQANMVVKEGSIKKMNTPMND